MMTQRPGLVTPEFDEVTHLYRLDGKLVPSITGILKDSGIIETSHYSTEARDRGTSVHRAIHYLAEQDLDIEALDPAIKPYLDGYEMFCVATGFCPDIIEQPLANRQYSYAGTPDQVQLGRAIADFKTGAHEPWHALQLAAQAFLLPNPFIYERWAVHLMDTGKYSLRVFPKQELQSDWAVFCSALNVANWRMRNGNGNSRNRS